MNSNVDRRLMVTCQAQSGSVPTPGNDGAAEVHCTDCLRIYIIVTELRLQTGPLTLHWLVPALLPQSGHI